MGPDPTGDPLTWINAIQAVGGAARCAEFTDTEGNPGVFPYAAATNSKDPTIFTKTSVFLTI